MPDSINTPENRERLRRYYAEHRPLVTTIHWTPLDERMPAYGQTVVVWLGLLGITVRAYRDARAEGLWRVAGTDGPPIDDALVSAWTDVPNGPLPPPDGGAV